MRDTSESGTYRLLGYVVRVLIIGEDTGGRLSMAEYLKPPGDMTPVHVHRSESQTTYVIEGEVTIYTPDGAHVVRKGECLYQPKDVPHTEVITSDTPARVLDVYAPAGFERFITSVGVETDTMELPATGQSPETTPTSELLELLHVLGIELLGPPGALPTDRRDQPSS